MVKVTCKCGQTAYFSFMSIPENWVCEDCKPKKEDQLLRCPFCGSVPYYPTNLKKNKMVTSCPNLKCPIHDISMTVKQWQRRF